MFNSEEFWKERLVSYVNEVRKYGRYIFNDHLKFVLFLGFGFGAYFYQKWIGTLQEDFPVSIVISIILGLFLILGSVQTLLKEGDRIFLLPLEEKMKTYFKRAFTFSFAISLMPLLFGVIVVLPLYWHFYSNSSQVNWLFFFGCLVLKFWHMYLTTFHLYVKERGWHKFATFIEWGLFSFFIYFVLERIIIGCLVVLFLLFIYTYVYYREASNGLFKWEKAISEDAKKMQLFYRVANLFTDIPHLQQQVHRRKWLDIFLPKENGEYGPYFYLLARTFFRSSDYFGLFVRLTLVGGIMMWIVPIPYVEATLSAFFLYLLAFQILPLWKHHQFLIWLDVYPLSKEEKRSAFLRLVRRILWISNVGLSLFSLFSSRNVTIGIGTFLIGLLFVEFFYRVYIPKRIEKSEELI